MKKIIFPILVIGLMLAAMPTMAAEIFVSSLYGNDSTGDGTPGNAYATIDKGLSEMSGGDSLYIEGSHIGSYELTSSLSGTAEGSTMISGWPEQDKPVITSDASYVFHLNGIDYLNLENMEITNGSSEGVIITSESNNAVLSGLEIYGNTGAGIRVQGDSINIANCLIYSNNTVDETMGAGIVVDSVDGAGIANCDIHNHAQNGVRYQFATTARLFNNIITSSIDAVNLDSNSASELSSNYNVFYNNSSSQFNVTNQSLLLDLEGWQSAYSQDANSLEADPLYVSTTEGSEDFQLTASSPCVDAGVELEGIIIDFIGNNRPWGQTVDIGAYEYKYLKVPVNLSSTRYISKADLDWDDVDNATSYNIKYGKGKDLVSATVIDVTSEESAKTITGLNNAGRYYWKVQAVNGEVISDWSETKRLITYPRKVKKGEIKVMEKESTTARIRIDSMAKRVTGFNIIVAKKTGNKYKKVKTFKVSNKSDKKYTRKWIGDLKPDTEYRIRVKARRAIGNNKYLSQNTVSKYFTTLSE